MRRNFYSTFPTNRAVIVQCAGIIEFSAIDLYVIIMETFIQWTFCSTHPGGIGHLFKFRSAPAAKAQADADAICIRRNYFETGIALRVDLRILLSWLI